MSGHSKWSNIKRKKEKTDGAKAKIFTKIGRELAVAVKEGVMAEATSMKKAATPASKATKSVNTESSAIGNASSRLTINEVQRAWKDVLESFKAKRAMIIYASI